MNIITVENERKLREKCIPIMKEKADYMNNLIGSMIELMIKNNGCGIAAPQVGINKRLFVAILDNERIGLFVNPTILEHSDEMEMGTEGCLSVPEKCGDVERYKSVKIRYFNGRKIVTENYDGLNARIIQHEYDHLNGILYIDKAENVREPGKETDKE